MKLEVTKAQLYAIIDMTNTTESMIGCADPEEGEKNQDTEWQKQIKLIDRMLKKNNLRRKQNETKENNL